MEPVSSVLVRGPVPLSQAAKIVIRVCKLLEPIHATGQPHGMLVPENVWFDQAGGDFDVELRSEVISSATYTPPERVGGGRDEERSDVYALGVLFFHMISGVPPFEGESADEVLQKHVSVDPPTLAHNELQDVPVELEALVKKMLAKTPRERPPVSSVAAIVENLDLDSTVMGMRLQNVKALAQEIQNEILETDSNEPADFDPAVLENVAVEGDAVRTDPVIADPYADTFIRSRAEFALEQEIEQDTAVSMPSQGANWSADVSTMVPDDMSSRSGRSLGRASQSKLLFILGAAFFVGAILALVIVLLLG